MMPRLLRPTFLLLLGASLLLNASGIEKPTEAEMEMFQNAVINHKTNSLSPKFQLLSRRLTFQDLMLKSCPEFDLSGEFVTL
jgi:hypothetical protein